MRTYFLLFDYWGEGYNKYIHGIYSINLKETDLIDFCRQKIRELGDPSVDPYTAKIKVLAFNNIEI